MQAQLENNHPNLDIEIFAINMAGTGAGASSLSSNINLPMVQDSNTLGIWNDWDAGWRDVFILNENNELVMIYNLTQNNLGNTNNYNTLMSHFIDIATP